MALAKIIVPVAAGGDPTAALDLARCAARPTSARIEFMCVGRDVFGMLKTAVGRDLHLWTADMMQILKDAADRHRALTRECFDGWMRQNHLKAEPQLDPSGWQPGVAWSDQTGNIEHLVARRGRFSELVVLDGAAVRLTGEASAWPVLEAALFDARRPVLIANGSRHGPIQSVLVAWDGSAEGLHALQAALPVLSQSLRIVVMTIGTAAAADPADETAMLDWLSCHGVFPERRFVTTHEGSVAQELLRQADACAADLIVMGAFRHSRLSESVFGGTTRHVIEHGKIPLLLAH